MPPASRRLVAQWLVLVASVASALLAIHFGLAAWFIWSSNGASSFQPATAEQVSEKAAPFQAGTKETNGLFKIVQQQHSELGIMFSFLNTTEELNWSLAVVGAAAFTALSLMLSLCLALMPRVPPEAAKST